MAITSLRESSKLLDLILKSNEMLREAGYKAEFKVVHSSENVYISFSVPQERFFFTGNENDLPQMLRMIADVMDLAWKGQY